MTDITTPHTIAVPKAGLQPHAATSERPADSTKPSGTGASGRTPTPAADAADPVGSDPASRRAEPATDEVAALEGPGWIRPVVEAIQARPVTAALIAVAVGATWWTLSRLKNEPA